MGLSSDHGLPAEHSNTMIRKLHMSCFGALSRSPTGKGSLLESPQNHEGLHHCICLHQFANMFLISKNKWCIICSLCYISESQRSPSRATDFNAARVRSCLRSRAAATSWEWKACRCTEEARSAAALHQLPWRTHSGLPASTETQERRLLYRLVEGRQFVISVPRTTNPMMLWEKSSPVLFSERALMEKRKVTSNLMV